VLASKSYLIALALVEGHLTVDEAAHAAHSSELLEPRSRACLRLLAAHDVDHHDVRVRLGSAALLVAHQAQLA